MSEIQKKHRYLHQILRVQDYVFAHLDKDFCLEELSEIAHLSPYHFHRIFKGVVGEPIGAYIRRIRLDRSALGLIYTQRGIVGIALDAGFESHEAFTRAFKKQFGITPSLYRKDRMCLSPLYEPEGSEGKLEMEVVIEQIGEVHLAYVKHVGPYHASQVAWDTLLGDAAVAKTLGPETQAIGIAYDNPDVTDDDKIRYDACFSVPRDFVATVPVGTRTLAGGRYATVIHRGRYEDLEGVYRYLFSDWMASYRGDRGVGCSPCVEFYLNDPRETAPEDLLTKICVPLQ